NAIDRYLDAFENRTLDADQLAERVGKLNDRHKQLRQRRDELRIQLDSQPVMPDQATLAEVSHHISEIITSGTNNQRKALIEALVAHIKITGPDRIVPVFRIPQPEHEEEAETGIPVPTSGVRTMTHLVELRGFEPLTPTLPVWCATNCATAPPRSSECVT